MTTATGSQPRGREREIIDGTVKLGKEYGVEMRFLPFAEMKYDVNEANKRIVSEAVAAVSPDVAFSLWPHDRHPDHEVASALSKVALRYADRLIGRDQPFRRDQPVPPFASPERRSRFSLP